MTFALDVIRDLEEAAKKLESTSGKSKMRDFSGLKSVPNVDVEKAFRIISQLESGGGYAIGDSGTSFGTTQVQIGSFLNGLAKDSKTLAVTGMSPDALRKLSREWTRSKKKMKSVSVWTPVAVDEDDVRRFMRSNRKKVVRRREGTTVRYKPEEFTIAKVNGNRVRGYKLDLEALRDAGLNVDSPTTRRQLSRIVAQYITGTVVRNAISKLITSQADPSTYARFQSLFSRRSVKGSQKLRDLADRAAQRDFMNKVNHVTNAVQESGYDTSAPGAYNIYQLIGIANASGAGRVRRFLRGKKPFGPAHLHYLQRANPLIAKVTGISSSFPSGGGLEGFRTMVASLNISKRAEFVLKFPQEYVADIQSGRRSMTIREGDIPAQVDQVVRCETYSGALIGHVLITSKEMMSVTRIRKAFGEKVADELERNFGSDARMMVIRFELHENQNDDDYDNNSFGKKERTNTPMYDGGTLEHVPFGREIIPVEPGHYHASVDFLLSKRSHAERLEAIWKLADDVDWEEMLRQEGLGEEGEEEEEVEEFSDQWKEEERQKIQQLERERKERAAPSPVPAPPPVKEPVVEAPKPKVEPPVEQKTEPKKEKPKMPSFEEHMKGVDIPTREEGEDGDEDEDFSIESLIAKIEGEEDLDELLDEFAGEEEADRLLDKRKGDEPRTTKVLLQNKNTVFGFKLQIPEGGWEGVPQPPAMTKRAQEVFSLSNLKTHSSMNRLFSKTNVWDVLRQQPNTEEIVQNWILPALVYNVGKRWFEIYSKRNQIGPITLFDREDIDAATKAGITLDQTPQGKEYAGQVITYVADATASYFSAEKNSKVPIADYVGAAVRNAMTREVGYSRGYKIHEKPVCVVCKSEEKAGLEMGIMKKKTGGAYKDPSLKKGIYTCARCAEKASSLLKNDVKQAKEKLSQSVKAQQELSKNIENVDSELEKLMGKEDRTPEEEAKVEQLQSQSEALHVKSESNNDLTKNFEELLDHHMSQVKKYQGQVNVPFYHVWCPKQDCPGQRVPLTAVDWSDEGYWTSDESSKAREYLAKSYLIVSPYDKSVKQEAEDIQPHFTSKQVREVASSEQDVASKLDALVGPKRDFSKVKELWKDHKDILFLDKELGKRIKKLHKLEGIMKKNPEYKGIVEEHPNLREILEHGPTQLFHIPPKELWDVPFVCPHDNVKFTMRNAMEWARKDIAKTDIDKEWSARGGLFYKPNMKRYWYKEGEKESGAASYDVNAASEDRDEIIAYRQLSDLARQIFLKRYWERFEIIEKFKKDNPRLAANPEKLERSTNYKRHLNILKLYDSVRQFSADSPEVYVGWLSSREFRPSFEQKQKGITQVTNVGSTKARSEEVYIPILQNWFDAMTKRGGGFTKHDLSRWLVDGKADGIPSYPTARETKDKDEVGKNGTHFLARIGASGFKMNLVSKKRRRGGFGSQPRMIRIVGVWEIPEEDVNVDTEKVLGKVALTPAEVTTLKAGHDNRIREIMSHTYKDARFDTEEGNFRPGNFMLVQAYLMPSVDHWPPIENIYRLREDADDERIFSEFGKAAVLNEDNPKFWSQFKKEVEKYKGSPEQVARLIRSKVSREKVSWLSIRGKFPLSIRDY